MQAPQLRQARVHLCDDADELAQQMNAWGGLETLKTNWLARAILTASGVGVFYASTIRTGHNWGDDFAGYILQAQAVASGHPRAESGYIYNPLDPTIGPRGYPPGFPTMLAPLVRLFGVNLMPMKLEVILFFVGALVLMSWLFHEDLPNGTNLVLLGLIGLNPYFWNMKDEVLSDFPFLFFTYAVLVLVYFRRSFVPGKTLSIGYSIILGCALYAAVATRAVGIVIIPALLLSEYLSERRLVPGTALALGVTSILILGQVLLFGSDSSYLDELRMVSLNTIRHETLAVVRNLASFWINGFVRIVAAGFFGVMSALAVFGYVGRARRAVTILETFAVGYALVVLVWPSDQGLRFLLPIIPLYLFYAFKGMDKAARNVLRVSPTILLAALVLVTGVSYAGEYTKQQFSAIRDGATSASATRLFGYLRAHTNTGDVFMFDKPRALALYAVRRCSSLYERSDEKGWWIYVARINASYLILRPTDGMTIRRFVNRNPDRFSVILRNDQFIVFSILPLGSGTALTEARFRR